MKKIIIKKKIAILMLLLFQDQKLLQNFVKITYLYYNLTLNILTN